MRTECVLVLAGRGGVSLCKVQAAVGYAVNVQLWAAFTRVSCGCVRAYVAVGGAQGQCLPKWQVLSVSRIRMTALSSVCSCKALAHACCSTALDLVHLERTLKNSLCSA